MDESTGAGGAGNSSTGGAAGGTGSGISAPIGSSVSALSEENVSTGSGGVGGSSTSGAAGSTGISTPNDSSDLTLIEGDESTDAGGADGSSTDGGTGDTVNSIFSSTVEDEPTVGCNDFFLVAHKGVTPLPHDALHILSQDADTVTIVLKQAFTFANSTIDIVYYQYQQDSFSQECYEVASVIGGNSFELTLECTHHNPMAILEVWIADTLTKNVLSEGDDAVIPNCCHPTNPLGTPVSKYSIEIKCVTTCAVL